VGGELRIRTAFAAAGALALIVAQSAMAQDRITGRVIDAENKQPIAAAQVQLTGTTIGVVTGDSGKFSLRLPSGVTSMTVRRIGYRQTTITLVAGTGDYTVLMARDVLQLEQQVITGVATTSSSKNAVTYDPVVTGAAVNSVPTPTVENALQGKVPGADIEQNSGAPGGGMQVNIRGVTSINASSEPLYVIDGVIANNVTFNSGLNALTGAQGGATAGQPVSQDQSVNRIADLNPNDIESIQVLEGAAAASIYGAHAAGGVILITTKKGVAGKPQVDVRQSFGTFNLEHDIPTRRYALSEAYAQGIGLGMDSATVLQNYNECHGFCDFQKSLYGGGQLSYESDVSVRGGSQNTNYFLSGLTKYDNGIEINTGYNKQAVRANINQNLWNNAVTVAANVGYTSSLTRRGIDGNDNLGISGYDVISYTPSWFDMAGHNPDGSYVQNPLASNANAYQDANEAQTPEEVNRTILGGTVDWKVFNLDKQSLDFVANGGADFTNVHDQFYLPPNTWVEEGPLVPASQRGVATDGESYARLSNYAISLIHRFTGLSWLNATTSVGVTRDKTATYQTNNTGRGLLLGFPNWYSGSVQQPFYNQTETNNQSFYGQEQLLLFQERLAVTGGLNAQRSTNDGGINRYYVYPKLAGSYRIPNLAPDIDELKIRAAYGQSGNIPIYGAKFNTIGYNTYDGNVGVTYEGATTGQIEGDKDIRPETNTDYEGGLDFTLFHSKMQLSGTVYQKRVTNLLLQESVAPSTGFVQAWTNGGQITNQGLEMSLTATPVSVGQFTWLTTEGFARNYSRVDASPVPTFITAGSFGCAYGCNQIKVGSSASAMFGYVGGNLVQMGDNMPAFTFTFGQDLSYGPVHVHVLFDWREGMTDSFLTGQYFDGSGYDGRGNLADTAAADKRNAIGASGNTAYLFGASFLKLRELSLKYDLPTAPIAKWGHGVIRSASLSLVGRNLMTWTRYPGADPEVSNFSISATSRGQDVTPYPPTRSYFISLELGL
jgi:TonB-dependent starch-binding outer membrane protein SusC